MEKVIVCLDFEVCTRAEWWTAALVAVRFAPPLSSDAEVLFALEVGSEPQNEPDAALLRFWDQHVDARSYNQHLASTMSLEEAECKLVEAFRTLRTNYPTFLLVGDNISFDIPLLDAILAKHGEKPSSWRNDSTYLHPLCTWSYRLALAHSDVPACFDAERQLLKRLGVRGGKHTPLFDCASTLTQFFRTLAHTPHSKLTYRWKAKSVARLQRR